MSAEVTNRPKTPAPLDYPSGSPAGPRSGGKFAIASFWLAPAAFLTAWGALITPVALWVIAPVLAFSGVGFGVGACLERGTSNPRYGFALLGILLNVLVLAWIAWCGYDTWDHARTPHPYGGP